MGIPEENRDDEGSEDGKEEKSSRPISHHLRRAVPFVLKDLYQRVRPPEQPRQEAGVGAEIGKEDHEDEDDDESTTEIIAHTEPQTASEYITQQPVPDTVEDVPLASYAPEPVAAPTPVANYQEAFHTMMQQADMGEGSAFGKAASGDILTDTEPGEPPAIERVASESEPPYTSAVAYDNEQVYTGRTPGEAVETPASVPSGSEWQPDWQQQAEVVRPGPAATVAERPDPFTGGQEAYYAEKRGLRRGLVAGFITGYAVKRYLANRKIERQQREQQQQVDYQQEALDRLQTSHHELEQRSREQQEAFTRFKASQPATERVERPDVPAAPYEQPLPPIAARVNETTSPGVLRPEIPRPSTTEHQVGSLEEAPVELQPDQHVEQDAWRRYVVDKHGHEVQDAMAYGHEYEQERAAERLSGPMADTVATPATQATQQPADQSTPKLPPRDYGTSGAGAFHYPPSGASTPTTPTSQPLSAQQPAYDDLLDNGQIPPSHSLPTGLPTHQSPQHLLPPDHHENPFIAIITSPWTLLIVSLMLLAYFVASFI